jgi:hypothetical protein
MKAEIRRISNDEYHGDREYLSASRMKSAITSMYHFANYKGLGKKKFFDIGSAFELYLTDRKEFMNCVHVYSESQRPEKQFTMGSAINKKWLERLQEQHEIVLTDSEYGMIKKMDEACRKNKTIINLVEAGEFQISVFWEDENGLKVKTRPDITIFLDDKHVILIDIKTTQDASPVGFSSQCRNLNYPFQAIMQIKGLEAAGYFVENYYYLAVEKGDLPLAQLYEFMFEDQTPLRIAYDSISKKIKNWQETGYAPGYEGGCDNEYGIQKLEIGDFYSNKMRNL